MVPLAYTLTAFVPEGTCRDDRCTRGKGTSPRACSEPEAPALLELCSSCLGMSCTHHACRLQQQEQLFRASTMFQVQGWMTDTLCSLSEQSHQASIIIFISQVER